ncbi:MAG TPA: hypothetical protein VJJ53_00625 [Candidatus Nanoarchaeia archaeon]|nr:hypothetical protein [Candidatus Nanoarchaeia archaeon]
MSEKDIIVPELKIDVKNSSFQMHELVRIVRSWSDLNRYILVEKAYSDKDLAAGKDVNIYWILTKDIEDYTRFQIDVKFYMKGRHINIKRKGKGIKGDIKVLFAGILITDRDSRWETPFYHFLRSFYDAFSQRDKFKAYRVKLDNEVNNLYNEVKAFLNLHAEK